MSGTLAMTLRPVRYGWAVQLTNGSELARFHGPGALWRAQRYLRRAVAAARSPFRS